MLSVTLSPSPTSLTPALNPFSEPLSPTRSGGKTIIPSSSALLPKSSTQSGDVDLQERRILSMTLSPLPQTPPLTSAEPHQSEEGREKENIHTARKVILAKSSLFPETLPQSGDHPLLPSPSSLSQLSSPLENDLRDQIESIKRTLHCLKALLKSDEANIPLRFKFALNCFTLGMHFKNLREFQNEHFYINIVKVQIQTIGSLNPLNSNYYHLKAMMLEYQGIAFKDLTLLKDYIKLLVLALQLNPDDRRVERRIATCEKLTLERWRKMFNERPLTIKSIESLFKRWKNNNELKELFLQNPALFKLSESPVHEKFFSIHPELTSIESFIRKYPSSGALQFYKKVSLNVFREELNKTINNPFIYYIVMSEMSYRLTEAHADVLAEAFLNHLNNGKRIHLIIREKVDLELIKNSIHKNQLVFGVQVTLNVLYNEGFHFYDLSIKA